MDTYTDFQNSPQSEKIGLVIVHNSQVVKGWEAYSGSIYTVPFSKVIHSIEDSGIALTQMSSLGTVVAGSFYHDRSNSLLYLRTSDSVDPNGKFVVAESKLFFSNVTLQAPHDLSTGFEVNWLPMLGKISSFGVELDNQNQLGFALEGSGSVEFRNDQDFWKPLFDKVTFENRRVFIYSWNRRLPFTEAKLIYRANVEKKSYSSDSIQLFLKDVINELRAPIPITDIQDYPGARVSSSFQLTKQRILYGHVSGHKPSNIDELIDGYYPLTGTFDLTNGSATVTGTGTSFLSQLSPNDTIKIADDIQENDYTVTAIASNTSLTLSEVFTGTTLSGSAAQIKPERAKRYMNRTFLMAGHSMCEPEALVTFAGSLAFIEIDDATDFEDGDAITVGSEATSVLRKSSNRLFLTPSLTAATTVGATVKRLSVSAAYLNEKRLTYLRDFTFDATLAEFYLDPLAEFNIAKVQKITGTVTFTNTSRAITGTGTLFDKELRPGDWIKAFGQSDYFEVLSVESATALTLRTASTYSVATSSRFKSPLYYNEGDVVLSVDCLGKTEDGASTSHLIKTAAGVVRDIISTVGISDDDVDEVSFDLAKETADQKISYVIPKRRSDKKTPIARDVINVFNQSVFGSLVQTNEFKLKYNILSPERDSSAVSFSEKDVLSFKINVDSSKIVKTVRINYLLKEYDFLAADANFLQAETSSDEGEFLVKTMKEFEQDSVLVVQGDAEILSSRFAFLFQIASANVQFETKLRGARLEINDKVKLSHEKLYERIGSTQTAKIAAVQSAKKTIGESSVSLDDLSNCFSRCSVITEDDHPDFVDSSQDQQAVGGYVTDNFGMQDNDGDTYGTSLIY